MEEEDDVGEEGDIDPERRFGIVHGEVLM